MLLLIFQIQAWEGMSVGEGRTGNEHAVRAPACRGSQAGALGPQCEKAHFPGCASPRLGDSSWDFLASNFSPTTLLGTGEQNDGAQDPTPRDAGCVLASPCSRNQKITLP